MARADEQAEAWRMSYGKAVARAWSDADYKARLLADSAGALGEAGVDVPAGVTVKVVENTGDTLHLVLPARPEGELTDEELEQASGGRTIGYYYRP
jgi:hypothetical protein